MSSPISTQSGIVWPIGPDGRQSTQRSGASIIAAALEPLDRRAAEAARAAARSWRTDYPAAFRSLTAGALHDPAQAEASAQAGLAALYETLQWADGDTRTTLAEAAAQPLPAADHAAVTISGRGNRAVTPWTVPYRGTLLQGDALRRRLADWQQAGSIEPGAAEALARCLDHPDWFDLSDRRIALLGAGSEAGPLRHLLGWRARLLLVSRPNPAGWQRIAAAIEAGNATAQIIMRDGGDESRRPQHAGIDLMRRPLTVAAWLAQAGEPLDVAALAYADGERHVRLSAAMDLIAVQLMRSVPQTSLAYLATPSDVYAVPAAVIERSRQRYAQRPANDRLVQALTLGRMLQPNVSDGAAPVIDGIIVQQGANYALAKRVQQWRALSARAGGRTVSFNIAPPSATASVVSNRQFAAAFRGAERFGLEVFEPETTAALMAALWVHDLRHPQSPARPETPLNHPFELFSRQACHGGIWSSAYQLRSALPVALLYGQARRGR